MGHGPYMAPGESTAERNSFGDVVLVERLRAAIAKLNPRIPAEAREDALRKVLRVATGRNGDTPHFYSGGSTFK